MLFAISDQVWLAVLAIIYMVVKECMDQWRAYRLIAKVDIIHDATNSMKDQLVLKTEQEALARGGVEERARAEERDKEK